MLLGCATEAEVEDAWWDVPTDIETEITVEADDDDTPRPGDDDDHGDDDDQPGSQVRKAIWWGDGQLRIEDEFVGLGGVTLVTSSPEGEVAIHCEAVWDLDSVAWLDDCPECAFAFEGESGEPEIITEIEEDCSRLQLDWDNLGGSRQRLGFSAPAEFWESTPSGWVNTGSADWGTNGDSFRWRKDMEMN
jgi:hypothetical protein